MNMFTRFLSLAILIALVSLSACQRRSQALFMPDRHLAAARATATPSAEHVPAKAAETITPITPVVDAEPATVLATTATDVRPYQQLNVAGRHSLVQSTLPQPDVKQTTTAPSIDKATRKELKRQWRQRKSQPAGTVSGLAIASLVCGILAFFVFGIVLGILAIIFGGVALSKIRKNPEVSGRGMAVAGLVLGIVATVVTVIYLAGR
ncbi:uncharacterized protein DUF4190 [Spirosoma oryzae]|uniref:Uncharacterized protein DUF4190 n=1 Tax=Spirosoma oryzae TaxID=1469603 RepID=A0A2T0SY74_9BACT|nr:DUF4190 domain-containing protein [Spirosoma oryzae]PRY38339.1 uncharacterized protein DUF4190 [Spirosoma oryzae]